MALGIMASRRGAIARQPVRYWVSTSGSDSNAGTFAAPFATLSKAHSVAVGGDVICVRGGTYTLTAQTNFTRSGSSGKPIVYKNFAAEVPVLDGINLTANNYILRVNGASYNWIKGFEIQNAPESAIYIIGASHNNTYHLLNIHHSGRVSLYEGKGLAMYGTGNNTLILNVDSHHNQDLSYSNADGYQIATLGSGTQMIGCRAWNNSDDGYDFFNVQDNTTMGVITITNCYAWHNGYLQDGTTQAGDGNGFKLGGRRSGVAATTHSGGHTVHGCMAWDNPNAAFVSNDADTTLLVHNNTAWDNGYGFVMWENIHQFKNNLEHANNAADHSNAGAGDTHNSWQLAVTVNDADFQSLSATAITGARNADGSVNLGTFLQLVTGSDLIAKGTDVGDPFDGAAPNLGAR